MSVFDNEWRDCLREQYKHTIRQNNSKNIASLRVVMNQVGFGEDELRQLEMIATMHIDDVADDFVPNLDILDSPTPPPVQTLPTGTEIPFLPHPLECQCPACVSVVMTPHDDEGQPITDPEAIEEARAKAEKDKPKQMTLF
ncbi:MAG: hypothetical protein MUE54_08690 [Anaerolineae bacterium]|jgi:hypothetical protein|nr:hypothetical protein [Anaerolineae bacterium]